ncbi:hypothetical protein FZ103_11360 [Streptomonospora sp. PA3]|uniref:DUF6892 domain-containing protein n=1 Tax=Streptomonospora sp. PA3 TaxID=2607326 RepID=UPI0012DE879C|nr:hypothetical protein [Streptomonospora sp. PA3]MUL41765.1 hypothetical protein [Streptomonospora sp. PA3]
MPGLTFTDLNAKLFVLEELCYGQGLLPPYESPHTPPDEPEYDPAAADYYRRLEIPEEAAASITELAIDYGLQVQLDIRPLWHGEDDAFEVTAWDELARLPALRLVRAAALPDAGRAAFRSRGVFVDTGPRITAARISPFDVHGRRVRLPRPRGDDRRYTLIRERLSALDAEHVFSGAPLVQVGWNRLRLQPDERRRDEWRAVVRNLPAPPDHPAAWDATWVADAMEDADRQDRLCAAVLSARDGAPLPAFVDDPLHVEEGADTAVAVELVRRPPGRDGVAPWFLGHQGSGVYGPTRPVRTARLGELQLIRPGAVPALALPPGFRVSLEIDAITSVIAPDGRRCETPA